jgi:hypothetical protein
MRKLITVAALGLALVAIPASASFDRHASAPLPFDPHFSVFEKGVFHETPDGFRFKGKLFDRHNRDDRVGRDRGQVKIEENRPVGHVRGVFHLNGEIGGRGTIKYRGNIRRNDNRLIVVGGTGDFNGVAGKLVFHNVNRIGSKTVNEFDLVR